MSAAIAANLGAICWHGPHQLAAKSTTTSCFCGVLASSWSNSAFECTECTEPTAPPAFERVRLPVLGAVLAAGLEAAAAGDGAASAGGARALGGLPGKTIRRSTRSHDCVRPVEAAGEAPPRSVSTLRARAAAGYRSASALRTHRRAATNERRAIRSEQIVPARGRHAARGPCKLGTRKGHPGAMSRDGLERWSTAHPRPVKAMTPPIRPTVRHRKAPERVG